MNEKKTANKYNIIKRFISKEERDLLLKKANRHFRDGVYKTNPAGPNRFVTRLDSPPQLDDLVERLTNRIVDTFALQDCPQEPVLNKLISRIEPGGYIHSHMDKFSALQKWAQSQGKSIQIPKESENFRCNIMVQMANESAYPVIDGEIVEVDECDAWGFLPSLTIHGTQLITGSARIIYGFGFIVPKDFNLVVQ